jgi:ABC-type transporter Mla subunit MlaD
LTVELNEAIQRLDQIASDAKRSVGNAIDAFISDAKQIVSAIATTGGGHDAASDPFIALLKSTQDQANEINAGAAQALAESTRDILAKLRDFSPGSTQRP